MLATETIVVYRSQTEQFWDQYLYAHPGLVLGFIGVMVGLVLLIWGASALTMFNVFRRFRQNRRNW